MAPPSEKLAGALTALKSLQDDGIVAVRSNMLSRSQREILSANGYLQDVIRGWYIPTAPGGAPGDTTPWYASYWEFCAAYLDERLRTGWCIGPEQSLLLQAGNRTVPPQLIIRSPKGRNQPTELLFGTSIFEMRLAMPSADEVAEQDGLRLFSLGSALVNVTEGFFRAHPIDARAVLSQVADASDILHLLLDGGKSVVAGRLAGAFRNIGRDRIADEILAAMKAAGHTVRETDPFDGRLDLALPHRERSPYAGRIRLMWQAMRNAVIENFPESPGMPNDAEAYLKRVDDVYKSDAYHSLSIEGYRVSADLIERVSSGNWDPDHEENDKKQRDAMAARGYFQAFQMVRKSVAAVLANENPGAIADRDHPSWYRELFAPSVAAGLLKPSDLAGYRTGNVFIRGSMHVPLPPPAVRDAMPVLFELLEGEDNAAVRAVLGHFVFVYIHPYMDGNGRMGRFLMNVMLASGGYPWTIVPVNLRDDYMAVLERASTGQDISRFARFLGELVSNRLAGQLPAIEQES